MTQKISEVQSKLKQSLLDIRWVVKENLHFTLKFLGPIEESKTGTVLQALERVLRPVRSFSMGGKGIGVFPNIKRARVLWVGLQGQALQGLAREVETALEPLGFEGEKRDFAPHLTIGRWRHFGTPMEKLKEEMERWRDYDFGQTKIKDVVFFQSVLKANGAFYSPLGVISLGAGPTVQP